MTTTTMTDDNEEREDEGASEPTTGALGIERWVQFAFIGAALFFFWFFDNAVTTGWEIFDDIAASQVTMVTAGSAVASLVLSTSLYRAPKVRRFAHDVAVELAKVSWPTRKETWAHTIVVMVVSAISAVIVFAFDSAWLSITQWVY
jgi:preprotein translocase subunit SecE